MTVWVDVTSTEHFFTSTVVEEAVTFTYTTTATDPCVREIDRPETKWLGGIPSWGPVDDDEKEFQDIEEQEEQKIKAARKKRVEPEL